MSLSKHLEEAAKRLEDASSRIDAARRLSPTPENLRVWMEALTDHGHALADIQRFNNESLHEKLHALAGRLGVEDVL